MKFGVCCNPDRSAEFAQAGFDFVEWAVASNLARFEELERLAANLPIAPEAWNILLPGDLKVVGPEVDNVALRTYLERVLPRVRALGGAVVVFGSGRSRTIPEGFDRSRAETQFEEASRIIADVAGSNDLTIVLEPLRKGETNLINTLEEGSAVVSRIEQDSLQLLADLYHMLDNGEDLASVASVADQLEHVHIASRPRFVPVEGDDLMDLREFLGHLKRAGYDRGLSFECRTDDLSEFERGLRVLRREWAAA